MYCDTSADTLDDPKTETMAHMMRRLLPDAQIGVVTTADVTDATPAAIWSYTSSRSDGDEIARQNVLGYRTADLDSGEFDADWPPIQVDVLLGGGGQRFHPPRGDCRGRTDALDLYSTYEEHGYKNVYSAAELESYTPSKVLTTRHIYNIYNLYYIYNNIYIYIYIHTHTHILYMCLFFLLRLTTALLHFDSSERLLLPLFDTHIPTIAII